jgi:hypothetical protein
MKTTLLLLLPIVGLSACAGQHPVSSDSSPSFRRDPLPDSQDTREPSDVHTYIVNDYIDPNNPRLRHRGHLVDAVEQDEKWKLRPVDDPVTTDGPDTTVNDPNTTPNPYSAEFETELAQQREQSRQLADLAARMTLEMGKLQDMTEKGAAAVSENASLRNRLGELQHEIDELKPSPAPPVSPNAPKKPSWLETIWDLLRQAPNGTPVVDDKPALSTNLVLRPADPMPLHPVVPTAPPVAPTNAPADPSPEPLIPSPGEMSRPAHDAAPQP